ncbi:MULTISPECIES: hypothetical protein [Streptomyces]|uniref:Uncharacterized protein n=2 Tax=Streptomyces TaxID=1883 RepID=A0ABV9J7R3_9ACTN
MAHADSDQAGPCLRGDSPRARQTVDLHLQAGARWDRITTIVLGLLFELTQQASRLAQGANPWEQLAVYNTDDFALFTDGGPTASAGTSRTAASCDSSGRAA